MPGDPDRTDAPGTKHPADGGGGTSRREEISVALLFVGLFGVTLARTAWLSDDAYITFRTILNFANGYGLTWNVGERVQAFTHPLWLFLVCAAHAATGEFFFTVTALSAALSVATLCLFIFGIARSLLVALLGATILTLSKAFVDYSTSGLENPLTHFLLALFCLVLLRSQPNLATLRLLSLIAGAAALNRMDSVLLFAPALLLALLRGPRRRGLVAVVWGFLPFLAWELFSVVYYGFPFPNTAYAKLCTGIARSQIVGQGFYYLLDSLATDPLTLLVIGTGLSVPFLVRDWRAAGLAAGIGLSLIYIVAIGGDFMSGRFLSASLLGGAILLSLAPFGRRKTALVPPFFVVLLAGLIGPHPPVLSDAGYGQDYKQQKETVDRNGISDERAFYYQVTGLLAAKRGTPVPSPRQVWTLEAMRVQEEGPPVVVMPSVGFFGLAAGPGVHVIDEFGLGDPLLARLPPVWRFNWRIGHFSRKVPDGYVESLQSGEDRLVDRRLAEYYGKLSTITRGPLFSARRWAEIVKLNLGAYESLIDADAYRYPGMLKVDIALMPGGEPPGANGGQTEPFALPPAGIQVDLGAPSHAPSVEVAVDHDHDYELVFCLGNSELSSQVLWAIPTQRAEIVARRANLPARTVQAGYDRIRILPGPGSGEPRFASLRPID